LWLVKEARSCGRGNGSRKRWSSVSTAAQSQTGRDRARESRLKAARERRRQLDPDQLARDKRIDDATVDVEVAWEARAEAERAVEASEAEAAAAVERLVAERLSAADVVKLTGLDLATVRRLRQTRTRSGEPTPVGATPGGEG
jgi:hypothetical protein